MQQGFQDRGQDQRRAEQKRREHGKARDKRIAEPQQPSGRREGQERRRALEDQPAVLRLLPGLRLRHRQDRHADRLDQRGRRGGQRADDGDREPRDPPFGPQAELAPNRRAVEAAERGRDVGQQRGCDQIAADYANNACHQRERDKLEHEHTIQKSC